MQGIVLRDKGTLKKAALKRPLPRGKRDFLIPTGFYRPCWVEIDRAALTQNLQALRRRTGPKTKLLAVVKANAYGHGLIPVAQVMDRQGAAFLGVSSVEEGVALRDAGLETPVLILGSIYPFDNLPILFEKQLTPTIASPEMADALDARARQRGQRLPVHLKIDSGFGRIGVSPVNALRFIQHVQGCRGLELQGLYTHFASSDVDRDYTLEQLRVFQGVVKSAAEKHIRPPLIHMANSSAVIRYPETHGTMVRPGLALYGIAPFAGARDEIALEPVLTWKTRVIFLKKVPKGTPVSYARTWVAHRPTRIATLAVGYADGYPRLLSNQGMVLLRGERVPVIGRVTMDMIMVDATDLPECKVGDEAVLLGAQGNRRITPEELATQTQTNPYEIVCRIAARVPRIYK